MLEKLQEHVRQRCEGNPNKNSSEKLAGYVDKGEYLQKQTQLSLCPASDTACCVTLVDF